MQVLYQKCEFFEETKKPHCLGEWVTSLLPFDLMPSAAHIYLFAGKVWPLISYGLSGRKFCFLDDDYKGEVTPFSFQCKLFPLGPQEQWSQRETPSWYTISLLAAISSFRFPQPHCGRTWYKSPITTRHWLWWTERLGVWFLTEDSCENRSDEKCKSHSELKT